MKLITVTTIATGQDITFTDENFPLSDDETFDGPT
jgi:hypothetical protein